MAGCYGNSPEDRYFETQLNHYLEESYPREFGEGEELNELELAEAEDDYNEHYSDKGD